MLYIYIYLYTYTHAYFLDLGDARRSCFRQVSFQTLLTMWPSTLAGEWRMGMGQNYIHAASCAVRRCAIMRNTIGRCLYDLKLETLVSRKSTQRFPASCQIFGASFPCQLSADSIIWIGPWGMPQNQQFECKKWCVQCPIRRQTNLDNWNL